MCYLSILRVSHAAGAPGKLRGVVAATGDMARNPPGQADVSTMEQTVKRLRGPMRVAEVEVNTIIQSYGGRGSRC